MGVPWWALVLIGLVGVIGVGIAIANSLWTHDWHTCQCVDCRQRRYKAHKRQGHVAKGVTPDGDIIWAESQHEAHTERSKLDWWSTAQLEKGMVIELKSQNYRVGQIRSDRVGYLVPLQPIGGVGRREPIVASVAWANGNRKYWKPGRGQ